ncbi:hypothetical protein HDU93_000625 [Gonapodya sp. JEL0774]|nr:hypothetical protein HDU93_000625 [Gonapodya sp. JEL0774]
MEMLCVLHVRRSDAIVRGTTRAIVANLPVTGTRDSREIRIHVAKRSFGDRAHPVVQYHDGGAGRMGTNSIHYGPRSTQTARNGYEAALTRFNHFVDRQLPENYTTIRDPHQNRGTLFSKEARDRLNLRGLMPPIVEDQREQEDRLMTELRSKDSAWEKNLFLRHMKYSDSSLFYRCLVKYSKEIVPLIYTPTVGEACLYYSRTYRSGLVEGLFISWEDRGKIRKVLDNWPMPNPDLVVVTDGSRVLGLGDLGANGMPIPVGKCALYVGAGGFFPENTLPILIDLGCDNDAVRNAPHYVGLKQKRPDDVDWYSFMDEFMEELTDKWPTSLVQFEDFRSDRAWGCLNRYRHKFLHFNDDIQGTGAVVMAGVIRAIQLSGVPLEDHRLLFVGAGAAGVGVASTLRMHFQRNLGINVQDAGAHFYMMDINGLLTQDRSDFQRLGEQAQSLARSDNDGEQFKTLDEVLDWAKPTVLIGFSTIKGLFTPDIIRKMATLNKRPIIMPLSNPISNCECTFAEAMEHSDNRVLFASGTAFPDYIDPVTNKKTSPGQGNNMFIFPGLGLGAVLSKCAHITDDLTIVSPRVERIREISAMVARDVAREAVLSGLSRSRVVNDMVARGQEEKLLVYITARMYNPQVEGFRNPSSRHSPRLSAMPVPTNQSSLPSGEIPEQARKKPWTKNVERDQTVTVDDINKEIKEYEAEEAAVKALKQQDAMKTMNHVANVGAPQEPEISPSDPEPPAVSEQEMESELPPMDPVLEEGEELELVKGVRKKLLRRGIGWQFPEQGDEVAITFVGRLVNSKKEFDRHVDRNVPYNFIVGRAATVINGWNIAVRSMKKKERCLMTLSPDFAYGEEGMPPTVPRNATVEFEIELLDWRSASSLDRENRVRFLKTREAADLKNQKQPKDGWECTVKYQARLKSSTIPFDSSSAHSLPSNSELFVFTLPRAVDFDAYTNPPHLPPFLSAAVRKLRTSEAGRYDVPLELAQGKLGVPVDANEACVYDVELVSAFEVVEIEGGKIRKKILEQGTGWQMPRDGETLRIVASIKSVSNPSTPQLSIGSVGDPFEYDLGSGLLPESLDSFVLPQMLKSSKVLVTASPSYGFTMAGLQKFEWNARESDELEIELQLIDFVRGKDIKELSSDERLSKAERLKSWGNDLWKAGRYRWAGKKWVAAMDFFQHMPTYPDGGKDREDAFRVTLHLNLTNWFAREGMWDEVLEQADKVLELAPMNVKGLYRRAQALFYLKNLDDSQEALQKAIDEDVKTGAKFEKELGSLMTEIQKRQRIAEKKEKTVYRNMFNSKKESDGTLTKTSPPRVTEVAQVRESVDDIELDVSRFITTVFSSRKVFGRFGSGDW